MCFDNFIKKLTEVLPNLIGNWKMASFGLNFKKIKIPKISELVNKENESG